MIGKDFKWMRENRRTQRKKRERERKKVDKRGKQHLQKKRM